MHGCGGKCLHSIFWPAYTGPGYSALPPLEGRRRWVVVSVGVVDGAEVDADAGGSRRACQDVDEVVAVSRKVTWPPGRRRKRRRHVCVFGGSRSSSSRVSHCGSRGWWAGDGRRLAIAIP